MASDYEKALLKDQQDNPSGMSYYRLEAKGYPLYFKAWNLKEARIMAKTLVGIALWDPLPRSYRVTKVR